MIYWYWNNLLSKESIDKLTSYIDENYDKLEPNVNELGGLVKTIDGNKKNKSNVKIIKWGKVKNLLPNVVDEALICNANTFGYNIFPMLDLKYIHYNVYKPDSEYEWHLDCSFNEDRQNDIKLTMLIDVSDDNYEGGEFQLNIGNELTLQEFKNPGDAVLFRSNTIHRVKPVTGGVRKSIALWFIGPRFQ